MRSARRKAYIERSMKKGQPKRLLFMIGILFLVLVFAFALIKITTKNWNGKDKFNFVFKKADGNIAVVVLDPKLGEATTLLIPGETEVDVAGNYGILRLKNVWQLGINEKVYGKILAGTVTQNFLFPTYLWADSDAEGIEKGNLWQILKFIFVPKKTNIKMGDRLLAGIFALKMQDLGRTEIDLGKSQFLHKEKLNDGELGYRIAGSISQRLTVYFSDNYLTESASSGHSLRFYIVDATGEPGISVNVGEILEVMGGKVVSIEKKVQAEDFDCFVAGIDVVAVKKISNLFLCQMEKSKSNDNLTIRLGTKFAKKF